MAIKAPTWTKAGTYIVLFKTVLILSKNWPRTFPPKTCLSICLGIDSISLILQATGGGLASQLFSSDVDARSWTLTIVADILFHEGGDSRSMLPEHLAIASQHFKFSKKVS
jgi:hypothetical protein